MKTISLYIAFLLSFLSIAQTKIENVFLDKNNDVVIGKNIHIKSKFDNLPLVEPCISAHPTNNKQLLVAAMVVTDKNRPYQSCRLSSFYSSDAGKTWEETAHDYWGYDPWATILPDGNTAMSWLGTEKSFKHQFPLKIFTSKNAGKTWDDNVQSNSGFGHGHDGTKLTGYKDDFYLTTVRFNGNMSADVVLYHSTNNGQFKEVGIIKGNGKRLNFCEPAVLTDGTVIVPTLYSRGKVWVNIYDPKTKTMSESIDVSENPKVGRGYSRMAADISANSRYKNRVYFVRAVAEGRYSRGVWLNYSSDKGKTWTKEKRIDLFNNNLKSKANVASVAVNKSGVLGISWVDGQNDPEQKKFDIYFAISKNGGDSFQRPVRVTSVSSNPRTRGNADVANKFIGGGHYLGLTTKADGSFQLVWSDTRTGIFQLQTSNINVK